MSEFTEVKTGDSFKCAWCGVVLVNTTRHKKRKYCGYECRGKARSAASLEPFKCIRCGKEELLRSFEARTKKFCSAECRLLNQKELRKPNRYVRTTVDGVVWLEHRFVMSEHLERSLLPEETVHHINGNRDDNRLSNLELWSSSHPRGQRVSDKITWAKEILTLYDPESLNKE